MTANFTKRMALAATAMGVVLTTPAFAQDAAAEGDDTGAIVVTARRVEEKLQDVPISITVFNQEAITNRNIINAGDLAIYTPSLATNSRFGPEKASFAIRGFQQDLATQPSVGVYFADVVAPRSGGSTTSGNGVGVGQLFDLQNVQVLKGPQGTLFGRNTTGGAVLLVPQKPTDRLEGYVEGSVGNYDMWRVKGVLNLPLADTFKVRLGVDKMKRDGYLRNYGVGPDRLANVDYITARLSILAELTPDLENYTIATYTNSDNYGIVAKVVGTNPNRPASQAANVNNANAQIARRVARGDYYWDVENNEPDPKIQNESWQAINTTTWQATDNLTIKNIASYAEFYETARQNIQGDNFLLANGQSAYSNIRLNNTPGYNNASQLTWTEELQFQGTSEDGKLVWQLGGYLENSDPIGYTSQSTAIGLNCPDLAAIQCNAAPAINFGPAVGSVYTSTISRPFQKTWFRSRGLYAQATYDVTEQLSVTGGIRYTWDKMTHQYNGQAIGFPATNTPFYFCSNTVRVRNANGTFPVVTAPFGHEACNVTYTAKSDKPTWLLNVDYKPTPDIMLYAKWARGYRAGGAASANIYFETWEPEKVDTYEIGAKTSFRGQSVRGYFNIAGFYNDFRNQQIQHSLNRAATSPLLGGSAILNAGKSRIWGVEVDAAVTLFDRLKLEGGYTYLDTKVLELQPVVLTATEQLIWASVTTTAAKGDPLAFSPKNRFTLTGTYTLPLDESIGRLSLGATWVHTSEQNAQSPVNSPLFFRLPTTNLVNLNASWNEVLGQPIDLSFFMTNVTNAKFPLAVVNAWRSYGYESAVLNEPRMFGFRLKYRFGQ